MTAPVALTAVGRSVFISFETVVLVLAEIVVTPNVAAVDEGDTQAFTAAGFDQFGDPFVIAPAWSVDELPVASIVVAPASATVASGATQAFTATSYDTYGNPVPVTPAWAVE